MPSADGKMFVAEDLPAGRYHVQVYGSPERIEGDTSAFTQKVLARKAVTLGEGKEERVTIGAEDKVGPRSP